MKTKPPYYRVYLLTVWQEPTHDPPEAIIWRYRLEEPHSGRHQLFADANSLLAALRFFATEPVVPPDDSDKVLDQEFAEEPPNQSAEKGGDDEK